MLRTAQPAPQRREAVRTRTSSSPLDTPSYTTSRFPFRALLWGVIATIIAMSVAFSVDSFLLGLLSMIFIWIFVIGYVAKGKVEPPPS